MSRPVRVLYLLDKVGTGGTASHLYEVLRHLDRSRFRPVVCCLVGRAAREYDPEGFERMNQHYRDLGAEVEVLELESIYDPRYLGEYLKLALLIRRHRIDLLHSYLFSSNIVGTVVGALTRVPVRVTSRREAAGWLWMRWYHRWTMRLVHALSTAVLVNTREIGEQCRGEGAPQSRIRLVYNGIDVEALIERLAEPASGGARPRDEIRHLGMVGNLVPIKGHRHLLPAMVEVGKEFPATTLTLVGDGPLRDELTSQCRELGLMEVVKFVGRWPAERWLGRFDAAIQTSLSEGGSNVLLEYMAAGLPIVATSVGGSVEILEHQRTAYLVPPADPDALAEGLLHLLRHPDRAAKMAEAAQATVRARYTSSVMVGQIEELYQDCLSRSET